MGRNAIDLTGQQFGRWHVIKRARDYGGHVYWWCECACGTVRSVQSQDLRSGGTQSCGCLQRELAAARMTQIVEEQRRYRPLVDTPVMRFSMPAGSSLTTAQQRNWQRERERVARHEREGWSTPAPWSKERERVSA